MGWKRKEPVVWRKVGNSPTQTMILRPPDELDLKLWVELHRLLSGRPSRAGDRQSVLPHCQGGAILRCVGQGAGRGGGTGMACSHLDRAHSGGLG